MNTIKRHNEQVKNCLTLLAKAGFTSPKNLQLAADRNRRGLPTQLKELGLVVCKEMTHGLKIYGLSKKGADLIGAAQFDIHKIGLSRVEHALIAQFETLTSIDDFEIEDYEFEPQKFSRNSRPDVVWDTKSGRRYYVEIELSPKSLSDGDMDRFFEKLVGRETIVIFKDSSLLVRYLAHARKYADHGIPEWQLIDKEWFKTGGMMKVTLEQWRCVYFKEHTSNAMMSIKEYLEEGLI